MTADDWLTVSLAVGCAAFFVGACLLIFKAFEG